MSKTKAIWYFGGEQVQIQQLQGQDPIIANVPAIHFPDAVWREQYKARTATALSGAALEPSALWIGNSCLLIASRAQSALVCKIHISAM